MGKLIKFTRSNAEVRDLPDAYAVGIALKAEPSEDENCDDPACQAIMAKIHGSHHETADLIRQVMEEMQARADRSLVPKNMPPNSGEMLRLLRIWHDTPAGEVKRALAVMIAGVLNFIVAIESREEAERLAMEELELRGVGVPLPPGRKETLH